MTSSNHQRRRSAVDVERGMITSGSFMGDEVAGEVGGVNGKPAPEAGRSPQIPMLSLHGRV